MSLDTNKGPLKIASGIAMMILGTLGFIAGKNIRTASVRLTVFITSIAALGSGFFLFVDGLDDMAVGTVGQYELGTDRKTQPMLYATRADFEVGLGKTFAAAPDLRRLHFRCPDGSKSFTVYNTPAGIFGIPSQSVVCRDGFPLLSISEVR